MVAAVGCGDGEGGGCDSSDGSGGGGGGGAGGDRGGVLGGSARMVVESVMGLVVGGGGSDGVELCSTPLNCSYIFGEQLLCTDGVCAKPHLPRAVTEAIDSNSDPL